MMIFILIYLMGGLALWIRGLANIGFPFGILGALSALIVCLFFGPIFIAHDVIEEFTRK